MLPTLLALLASYLLGSVPFGLVMARLIKGVDLREVGSGNIGATNAMRVLGKPLGLVAFLLDFGKGLVPTLFLSKYAADLNVHTPLLAESLCGVAAVVGHCFPIYLKFRGGKGVATGCGAIVGIEPMVFVASGLVWVALLGALRMVSLASIAMGLAFPIVAAWLVPGAPAFAGACALLTVLVLVRHRANIARIRAGTEPRIGAKPSI
ncbi:Glycerol-3-phosphate acyltransferase [Planctomycetes bacterium Poly30]|uniref:Glycerol-3-phosphate acyltransferase n=1 Tax=Saltatorellus ferox TaxID=2528018 RepID=A0A518ENN3_9BACT|nr:Glycerol-3-phosphate acyltransferase [Planctomycetes bacterium Poly30]